MDVNFPEGEFFDFDNDSAHTITSTISSTSTTTIVNDNGGVNTDFDINNSFDSAATGMDAIAADAGLVGPNGL